VDPGFQARGSALKKIAPSGGRHKHFWGISCEKSRFYAKQSYFFDDLAVVLDFLDDLAVCWQLFWTF
jgi:hypothetical protein